MCAFRCCHANPEHAIIKFSTDSNIAVQVRAGATILFDSDPEEEEAETRLKASAFLDALSRPRDEPAKMVAKIKSQAASIRVLLVDHEVRYS